MVNVLELFCGAGLATRGLIEAGAKVTGVDIAPQPRFPGSKFVQTDVMRSDELFWLLEAASKADFIWASPPCQFGSAMRHAPNAKQHANLIPRTRDFCKRTGKPYVIENVEGARAHLHNPVMLCGSMFGLGVTIDQTWYQLQRHRYFEASFDLKPPGECFHYGPVIGVYGSHTRIRAASVAGGRGTSWPFPDFPQNKAAERALGVVGQRLSLAEMSQGIPPAYARYILNSWKRTRQ